MALSGLSRVRRGGLVLLAAGTLLAGWGCAAPRVYREGNATIVASVGDRIAIELASDPATGYSWALVGHFDPGVLTLVETDYVQGAAGGSWTAGHQRWTFRIVGRGATTVTFSHGRTWANAPAEKATLFNVTAR